MQIFEPLPKIVGFRLVVKFCPGPRKMDPANIWGTPLNEKDLHALLPNTKATAFREQTF